MIGVDVDYLRAEAHIVSYFEGIKGYGEAWKLGNWSAEVREVCVQCQEIPWRSDMYTSAGFNACTLQLYSPSTTKL